MRKQGAVEGIREKYKHISPYLNERTRRIWAATEARLLGYGGITAVSEATGISQNTIRAGQAELKQRDEDDIKSGRIRSNGGGRKKLTDLDNTLKQDLDALVEPSSRGDPESPLGVMYK